MLQSRIPPSLVWAPHVQAHHPLLLEHSQASCLGLWVRSCLVGLQRCSQPPCPSPGPCVPLSSHVEYVYPDFSYNGKYSKSATARTLTIMFALYCLNFLKILSCLFLFELSSKYASADNLVSSLFLLSSAYHWQNPCHLMPHDLSVSLTTHPVCAVSFSCFPEQNEDEVQNAYTPPGNYRNLVK